MDLLGMMPTSTARRAVATLLGLALASSSATAADHPGIDLRAASARLGTPLTWLQSCDAAGKFVLARATATGALYLVRQGESAVAVSKPLVGREENRGVQETCAPGPEGDGRCKASCAAGPSGIQLTFVVNHNWTRQSSAYGRERLRFDVAFRDGAFLVERVSKLIGAHEAKGFGWEAKTYEEKVDFADRRYETAFTSRATPSEEEPAFFQDAPRPLARGRALVAGPDFRPDLAFSDFRVTHGKAAWKGPLDLSALAFVRWEKDKLSFRIAVKDDVVRPGSGVAADHIEIWMGRGRFENNQLRRKGGDDDRQILVSMVDGKVLATPALPAGNEAAQVIEGHYGLEAGGYTIEFSLPAALLLPWGHQGWSGIEDLDLKSRQAFFEGDAIPFTLVVSDGDGAGQKALLASSDLKWNAPTTFGRLLLIGRQGLPELNAMQETEELSQ